MPTLTSAWQSARVAMSFYRKGRVSTSCVLVDKLTNALKVVLRSIRVDHILSYFMIVT